jgi:hypothetical protein
VYSGFFRRLAWRDIGFVFAALFFRVGACERGTADLACTARWPINVLCISVAAKLLVTSGELRPTLV